MITRLNKYFDAETLTQLRGIQAEYGYRYELVQLSLSDIMPEVIAGYSEDMINALAYPDMINHLRLGGTLPAITLSEDMNVLDGQHRIACYIKLGIDEFYGLIKTKIMDTFKLYISENDEVAFTQREDGNITFSLNGNTAILDKEKFEEFVSVTIRCTEQSKKQHYTSELLQHAVNQNSKHLCPYSGEPCNSAVCGVRHSGVCNTLEILKHADGQVFTLPSMEEKRNKTPKKIKVGEHLFWRYLMDNEYAEEMKCNCGFVIWACQNEAEAKKAVIDLGGDINNCPPNLPQSSGKDNVGEEKREEFVDWVKKYSDYREQYNMTDAIRYLVKAVIKHTASSPSSTDAVEFLDHIREYEREAGKQICYDERTSAELYNIFINSKK